MILKILCVICFSLCSTLLDINSKVVWLNEIDNTELECLVKNAFHEANTEGEIGILLVTHVVINRARTKNKTYCETVYKYKQFSWTLFKEKQISDDNKIKIRNIILAYYYGFTKVPVQFQDASYYHTKKIRPYWSKSYECLGSWKNHIFYKDRR